MKRKILFISTLTAVLLFLISAALLLRDPPGSQPPPADTGELAKVYELDGEVLSIHIEQAGKEPFTLVRQTTTEDKMASGTLAGRDSLPVDLAKAGAVLSASSSLVYTELVHESTDDYAQFGLDLPRARVTVTADAGEKLTLIIGNAAPGNIGVYLRLENEPAVYLVPSYTLDNYLLPELDYLSHTITPQAGYPLSFRRLTLSGGVRYETGELVIVPGNRDGYYSLESPYSHPLDPSTGMSAVQALFGLQSGNLARLYPSDNDLEELGLDDPWAFAVLEDDETGGFSLSVSHPNADGTVFLYREGVPLIYTAHVDDLPWAGADAFWMISKTAFSPALSGLTGVSVITPEREYAFSLERKDDDLSVALDSSALDSEDFTRFFETMAAASFQEPASEEPPDSGAVLAFIYSADDSENMVEFYPSEQPRRYLVRVDGGTGFLTSSLYVDRVLESLDRLITGRPVPTYLG